LWGTIFAVPSLGLMSELPSLNRTLEWIETVDDQSILGRGSPKTGRIQNIEQALAGCTAECSYLT
jgi:hypothetical protein